MSLSAPNTNEPKEPQARRIWFDESHIFVELVDGRSLSVPLSFYPLLLNASKVDREDFRLFAEDTAIHFNRLDADLPIEALVMGRKQI